MEGLVLHLFGPTEVALPYGEPARRHASPKCPAPLAFLAPEAAVHQREEIPRLRGNAPEVAALAPILTTSLCSNLAQPPLSRLLTAPIGHEATTTETRGRSL